jgi:type VI protein secretion system component VasF
MTESSGPGRVVYKKPAKLPEPRPRPLAPGEGDGGASRSKRARASDPASPLLQICEPLFARICLYSQAMQSGARLSYSQVRRDVEEHLKRMREAAHSQPATAGLYDENLEQSLLFFVDNFFSECSQSPLNREWAQNRLALTLKPPNFIGDEQFFTNLEKVLKERGEGVRDKLAVYYTCIGLGMTGIYASKPQMLRKKQSEIVQKIRDLLENDPKRPICRDAYESINTENLIEPPIKPPMLIAVTMVGMILVLVLVYFIAYATSTQQLQEQLRSISQTAAHPAAAAAP